MPVWCLHAGVRVALGLLCVPPGQGAPSLSCGPELHVRGPSSCPRSCVGPPPRGRSEPALLLQTASGNVEAKVVCFYRRRDISSSLIALADKHASESAARAAPAPGGPTAPVPGSSAGCGGAVHVLGWTVPCTVPGSQA